MELPMRRNGFSQEDRNDNSNKRSHNTTTAKIQKNGWTDKQAGMQGGTQAGTQASERASERANK
eukprot:5177814-Amphidinium_carterae.1